MADREAHNPEDARSNRAPASIALRGRRTTWVMRALAGIGFGVALTLLNWIGSTTVEQLRATVTMQTQISYLTKSIADLKTQLAGVPEIRDRLQRVETRQEDIEHRVKRLEDRPR